MKRRSFLTTALALIPGGAAVVALLNRSECKAAMPGTWLRYGTKSWEQFALPRRDFRREIDRIAKLLGDAPARQHFYDEYRIASALRNQRQRKAVQL